MRFSDGARNPSGRVLLIGDQKPIRRREFRAAGAYLPFDLLQGFAFGFKLTDGFLFIIHPPEVFRGGRVGDR